MLSFDLINESDAPLLAQPTPPPPPPPPAPEVVENVPEPAAVQEVSTEQDDLDAIAAIIDIEAEEAASQRRQQEQNVM